MHHEKTLAYLYPSQNFDCGTRLGYLIANFELGLVHPELGVALRQYKEARLQDG